MKTVINTDAAPAAIGTYSQAMRIDNTIYISGQIPLDPRTLQLVEGYFKQHLRQVFKNVNAIAEAAGASLSDLVKLTVYLLDMNHFPLVNEVMAEFCIPPYPARAVLAVSALPKNAIVEMDAILCVRG